jgi:tetratricopeptide (TPR) repeat protein
MNDGKQSKKRRLSRRIVEKAEWSLFDAEAAYAESIFRLALGDNEASIAALRESLERKPDCVPAILSVGSVEYQLGRHGDGRKLFHSLLSLPKNTPDLAELIDEAGDFLIDKGEYEEGLELYRAAVARFPKVAVFHQGLGCCAGHRGLHDEAVAASRRALELEPDNQKVVNDLGYCLFEAGMLREAEGVLEKAVIMDTSDDLARNNLAHMRSRSTKPRGARKKKK